MKTKKYIRTTLIVLIWLVIWQVLSLVVNNDILLSGPVETFKALITLGSESSFYLSVGMTVAKILLGFIIGMALGVILAILSYRIGIIREFFSPFVSVIKSIPIVSFIIIALIWAGNSFVTIIVSALLQEHS